jgi:glycosyltransferase involved in cell wall biosynthesis
LYRQLRPSCVLHFTIKPVVYGSFAARTLGVPTINTITGLGSAFLGGPFIQNSVSWLLRRALVASRFVVFQNRIDSQLFASKKLVTTEQIVHTFGSGVDLGYFSFHSYPTEGGDRLTLIARMLRDKGVEEFVACAKRSHEEGLGVEYTLVGPLESPAVGGIPEADIKNWVNAGFIDYIEKQDDIRPWITQSTCVVLPSYREGMARILMEACAMGRPVITTNVPGCSDIVDSNKNGFLCEARDASSLFEAIARFTCLPRSEKIQMGYRAHEIAHERFSDLRINEIYISLIQRLC